MNTGGINSKLIRWLSILTVLIIHLAALGYYGVQVLDISKFFISILICTLVPGLLVLSYGQVYDNDSYKFALAAAIGICLDIIIFIILSILDAKFLFYFIFALILLLYLARRKLWSDLGLLIAAVENLPTCYIVCLGLASLLFLTLVIIFLFIPNPLPGVNQSLIYYIDQPWHLGNIAELKNHWYPQDPRLAGNHFHYHIFAYIYTAFIAWASGISVPVLFFRLNTLFLLYLLFIAAYFTGSRWFNRRSAGILNIFAFFFGGTALLSYPFNIFLINFFTSPTFLLASILTLFLFVELRIYLYKGEPGHLFLSLLLILGLCGAKGSFFPVIFAGLLGSWGYNVLIRKPDKRLNILLVSSLFLFLGVFSYIFKGIGSEGINIVPFEVIRYTRLFDWWQGYFGQVSSNWLIWSIVPIYLLAFFSFRALAFIKLIKSLLVSLPNLPFDKLFMAGVIIASFIPGYFLSYRGRSEYFYLFVGYICLNLISAGYLYDVYKQPQAKLLKMVVLVFLLASTADTVVSATQQHQIIPELKAVNYQPLTPSLYEGLTYLRDHTDPDAIIASYRSFIYADDNPRFFYYSAFSERRMVVEGWQYMPPAYQEEAQRRYADMATLYTTGDAELAARILDKYSVDYLILETAISQKLNFNGSQILIPRFQNKEMEIYQTVK